jgi:hypothetical protein
MTICEEKILANVSQDSVCIALTIAALNNIEVLASNVQNAYITAPNSK